MTNSKQYHIVENSLILSVKKSFIFVRIIFYTLALISIVMPFLGIIWTISDGSKIKFGHLLSIFIFGFVTYYFLRIALWNSYGKELITLSKDVISYSASYGLFKGQPKEIENNNKLNFSYETNGFAEDNEGVLVISNEEKEIKCVTKMKIPELETLVSDLRKSKYLILK